MLKRYFYFTFKEISGKIQKLLVQIEPTRTNFLSKRLLLQNPIPLYLSEKNIPVYRYKKFHSLLNQYGFYCFVLLFLLYVIIYYMSMCEVTFFFQYMYFIINWTSMGVFSIILYWRCHIFSLGPLYYKYNNIIFKIVL